MAYSNQEKRKEKRKAYYIKNKVRNRDRRREYFREYMKARYKRKILAMVGRATKLSDSIAEGTELIRKNQIRLERKIKQIKEFVNIK